MTVVKSDFMIKGYKNENEYYIVKNADNNYNVYQLFCAINKDMTAKHIKSISPNFKALTDDELIVSIPSEKYTGFLFLHDIDISKMNEFRISLHEEKIIENKSAIY